MAIRGNKEYTEKEFNGRKVRPVQYFALGKKKRMCGYYYPMIVRRVSSWNLFVIEMVYLFHINR